MAHDAAHPERWQVNEHRQDSCQDTEYHKVYALLAALDDATKFECIQQVFSARGDNPRLVFPLSKPKIESPPLSAQDKHASMLRI
jgi:hypothetical protein